MSGGSNGIDVNTQPVQVPVGTAEEPKQSSGEVAKWTGLTGLLARPGTKSVRVAAAVPQPGLPLGGYQFSQQIQSQFSARMELLQYERELQAKVLPRKPSPELLNWPRGVPGDTLPTWVQIDGSDGTCFQLQAPHLPREVDDRASLIESYVNARSENGAPGPIPPWMLPPGKLGPREYAAINLRYDHLETLKKERILHSVERAEQAILGVKLDETDAAQREADTEADHPIAADAVHAYERLAEAIGLKPNTFLGTAFREWGIGTGAAAEFLFQTAALREGAGPAARGPSAAAMARKSGRPRGPSGGRPPRLPRGRGPAGDRPNDPPRLPQSLANIPSLADVPAIADILNRRTDPGVRGVFLTATEALAAAEHIQELAERVGRGLILVREGNGYLLKSREREGFPAEFAPPGWLAQTWRAEEGTPWQVMRNRVALPDPLPEPGPSRARSADQIFTFGEVIYDDDLKQHLAVFRGTDASGGPTFIRYNRSELNALIQDIEEALRAGIRFQDSNLGEHVLRQLYIARGAFPRRSGT